MVVIARSSEMIESDAAISDPVTAVKADLTGIKGIKGVESGQSQKVKGLRDNNSWNLESLSAVALAKVDGIWNEFSPSHSSPSSLKKGL